MKAKFIVCSRAGSRRVPNKPFVNINGKPIIEHLCERLIKISTPVYIAIPPEDVEFYSYLDSKYEQKVIVVCGSADDPLDRMGDIADWQQIDHVIRVSHDKIFIDPDLVSEAVNAYMKRGLDYLYSSTMTDGTAFEIISRGLLNKARAKFKKVEHISYAVKALTENSMDYDFSDRYSSARLLIDFPEDITFMNTLMASIGNDASLQEAYDFIDENPWIMKLNALPLVTVYTCGYNCETYIQVAMESVMRQYPHLFGRMEYILVDDHSTDKTSYLMSRFAAHNKNVKYIRNDKNIGLASSSNVALSQARGRYIIRLDADDYFTNAGALAKLYSEFLHRDVDVVYPAYYDGSMHRRGNPKEHHHPAGAMFKTRALNHIKFTDRLRHYDGLDLYQRAKEQLRIGYLQEPLFFYRHTPNSMSRTNLAERAKVRKELMNEQICGD